jgi:hypothetical protein
MADHIHRTDKNLGLKIRLQPPDSLTCHLLLMLVPLSLLKLMKVKLAITQLVLLKKTKTNYGTFKHQFKIWALTSLAWERSFTT